MRLNNLQASDGGFIKAILNDLALGADAAAQMMTVTEVWLRPGAAWEGREAKEKRSRGWKRGRRSSGGRGGQAIRKEVKTRGETADK